MPYSLTSAAPGPVRGDLSCSEPQASAFTPSGVRDGSSSTQTSSPFRVLVVDSDLAAADGIGRLYRTHGFHVRTKAQADSALSACRSWRPHLVIAEAEPTATGSVELCRRVRARSVAALIIVSRPADEATIVAALDAGADDYLVRPCSASDLLARSRAVLRRALGGRTQEQVEVGVFRLDVDRRKTYVHGREVKLTPKAFDLLVYFARHPNRVIERSCLLKAVWCADATDHPEYLRAHIGQIRKQIEPEPSKPRFLLTESWVGYRFNPVTQPPTN